MKRIVYAASACLAIALSPVPAAAQDDRSSAEFAQMGELFGDMFGVAEDLTDEQEARLPAAMQVATRLMPEGTYARMMDETMGPIMEGMMGGFGGSPALALAGLTGLDPFALNDIEDAKLAEAVALLDPNAAARNTAMGDAMFGLISEVVVEIEPAYRAGLARAYAVRFTEAELADLAAYFQTPVGSKYAAESFLIFADPQVMSAMNEMMPAMMERMPAIISMMEETAQAYPQARRYSDLDAGERAQLAGLLGVSEDELAASQPATPMGGSTF